MKVMLLANEAPEDFSLRENKEQLEPYMGLWYAYGNAMREAGVYLDGVALEPPSSATVVSVRDGVRKVEDGPYPDTKEQLGGVAIIEAPDVETALHWAAQCPSARNGFVETRPVMDLEEHTQ